MVDRIGQKFGNYYLMQLLGHGGFADVYLGEHMYLQTQVAIKVLNGQLTQKDLDDFRNEAQIIAQLLHPNIVRVHDFGVEPSNGIPFLIMEYAPNGTLDFPSGTILQTTDILLFVKQASNALQYVHDAKLIHCDVKPENLLLGRNNEVWLSDFGIAVVVQNQNRLSAVGTVQYMAPEQIKGRPCAASDQYSLAVVIYEWLCGVCPFEGASSTAIASEHLNTPPPSLREKVQTIPIAVENVILKALSKNPQQRFPQIRDFTAALERACQTASLNTSGPSLLPTNSGSRLPTTKVLPDAVSIPTAKVSPLPTTKVLVGVTKVMQTMPIVVVPLPGTSLYTYRCHSNLIYTVAWSPDSLRIASGGDDRTVQVWDATTGNNVFVYHDHTRSVRTLMWSPNGKLIVSGGANQIARVWDATTGRCNVVYREHAASPLSLSYSISWSPVDGMHVASGGADKTVQMWDAATGRCLCVYRGHAAEINAVAWSPDGMLIASASDDMTVQIWDEVAGDNVFTYRGHIRRVRAIAWSPDGKRIASASEDTTVQVWDAFTGNAVFTYRNHDKRVRTVAWSPDGSCIASAGDERTIQVWDATTGALYFSCEGHTAGVNAVAWSPDGQFLATASNDMTIQIWQAK